MSTDDRTGAVPCLHGVAGAELLPVCDICAASVVPVAGVHASITIGMVVADKDLVKAMVRELSRQRAESHRLFSTLTLPPAALKRLSRTRQR